MIYQQSFLPVRVKLDMIDQTYPVSERLIEAVAAEIGTNPIELPLLYETIDPDALDALVESLSGGEITFSYAGCAVTVESTGAIEINERSPGTHLPGESAIDE
jgi:hypothetical protein